MKKIIIIGLVLSMMFLVGCQDKETNKAYFNIGTCCDTDKDWQLECDTICEHSGIRINEYRNQNIVKMDNCQYICRCY